MATRRFPPSVRRALLGAVAWFAVHVPALVAAPPADALVFVSRQIPDGGTIYWSVPKSALGIGPHSRFRVAAPGKLLVRETNGTLRTLIDGAAPTAGSLNLIDVNAPDVSWDGTKIVFAGLPQGTYSTAAANNPGAWRLYVVNADGSGLRQLTFSDRAVSLAQFGGAASGFGAYDDTDPCWLPDGRIVFSSTRHPVRGHYSGVRGSNLFVVNADGSALHRITSERNGADRPQVDPLTGRIVYARWWRNHRFPTDDPATVTDPAGGYRQKDGLTTDRNNHVGGSDDAFRNAWQLAFLNPDGSGLAMFNGFFRSEDSNNAYGGAFLPTGEFLANYLPMLNLTEASGFGGVRRHARGGHAPVGVAGHTSLTLDFVSPSGPTSFGVEKGEYAMDPGVLSDGRIVVSHTRPRTAGETIDANSLVAVQQDYGLYVANADGSALELVYDHPGTAEIRARALRARPLPPIVADSLTATVSMLPPTSDPATFRQDGTFVFDALNVYGNAPVDADIVSAPAVGSAATIRFYLDHQRTSPGSFPNLDWPILLGEAPVSPAGEVIDANAPANVSLFEELRNASGQVPLTPAGRGFDGSAHVAGMNFGRTGATAQCIGCHAGHSMIPVPRTREEARWSNLAPGAGVTTSTVRDANYTRGVVDRRNKKSLSYENWHSAAEQRTNQWVALTFPVEILVRTVRLHNHARGGEGNSTLQAANSVAILYADAAGTVEVARRAAAGAISEDGTNLDFPDVRARGVKVEVGTMTGTVYGLRVASLGEIEVIAQGAAPVTSGDSPQIDAAPAAVGVAAGSDATFGVTASGSGPLSYRWQRRANAGTAWSDLSDGAGFSGTLTALLTVRATTVAQSGEAFRCVVTNSTGSATSPAATLTVLAAPGPPLITSQPASATIAPGQTTTLTVAAGGSGPFTYQWFRGSAGDTSQPAAGATAANFSPGALAGSASFWVRVTNAAGSVESVTATVTVAAGTSGGRLLGLSVRSTAGSGERTLIAGFAVRGPGTKRLLLRGVGPTLRDYGLGGALDDPRLHVFASDGTTLAQNDDWGGDAALAATFAELGEFALAASSKDAALLTTLAPGAATAHVSAAAGTGLALVECYDAGTAGEAPRLVAVSARSAVGTGADVLIAGFVLGGNAPLPVLVRGLGPALAPYGIAGALADPELKVFNARGELVASNDNWGGVGVLAAAFTATGTTALPADSRDAALLLVLEPGAYTAHLGGVGGTTGVGLVEVYEAP